MLKVKILSHTPNPEEVIASAAKLCYSPVGVEEIMEKQSDESVEKFIKRLASMKHLSPFEHASFSFAIEGVSRTLTHQLVRHRIASFSQQSQRYVKEDTFEYVVPPAIKSNDRAYEIFLNHMIESQNAYDDIVLELILSKTFESEEYLEWCDKVAEHEGIEFGDWSVLQAYDDFLNYGDKALVKEYLKIFKENFKNKYPALEKEAIEDARYVFPNATETKIVLTMNARSLMNFFTLRCCSRAQWEIRALADEMLAQAIQVAPAIFMNSGASCTFGKCQEGSMSCGIPRTLEDIVGQDVVALL